MLAAVVIHRDCKHSDLMFLTLVSCQELSYCSAWFVDAPNKSVIGDRKPVLATLLTC